jgi:phage tail protein X
MSDTYETVQGDTWDMISYRLYKSEGYIDRLITLNPEHAHRVIFPSGITLQVPVVTKAERVQKDLPPWRL